MATNLPLITTPSYELPLPSDGSKIQFRPFLVKEEKILLMAVESKDEKEMLSALRQIIVNCVENDDFDVDAAPLFDLEYIFLKLRAKSVGEVNSSMSSIACLCTGVVIGGYVEWKGRLNVLRTVK